MSGDGLPDFVFGGGEPKGPCVEILVQGKPFEIPKVRFIRGDCNGYGQ